MGVFLYNIAAQDQLKGLLDSTGVAHVRNTVHIEGTPGSSKMTNPS